MLEFMQDNAMQTLDCDDYYIQTEWNGADNTLHISLPTRHPQMLALQERTQIYDSEDGQESTTARTARFTGSANTTGAKAAWTLKPSWIWTAYAPGPS